VSHLLPASAAAAKKPYVRRAGGRGREGPLINTQGRDGGKERRKLTDSPRKRRRKGVCLVAFMEHACPRKGEKEWRHSELRGESRSTVSF